LRIATKTVVEPAEKEDDIDEMATNRGSDNNFTLNIKSFIDKKQKKTRVSSFTRNSSGQFTTSTNNKSQNIAQQK